MSREYARLRGGLATEPRWRGESCEGSASYNNSVHQKHLAITRCFCYTRLVMVNNSEEQDVDFEPENDPSRLVEDEAELGDVAGAQAKLKKLKDELATVKAQRQEYLDGWQRCKADSVNLRKETLANAERLGERAKEGFIEDIIPALDGFDMAAGSSAWEKMDAGWRSGIEQIRNQLLDVLSRHGVERFGKVGESVDHAAHETIEESGDLPGEPGTVVKILRYGYKMNGRVLRAAQVIVKK